MINIEFEGGQPVIFENGKIRKQRANQKGYLEVTVGGKRCKVHRLVAMKFVDNDDLKPEVNHKNGNKQDNSIINLEWVTRKENMDHAFDNGLHSVGRHAVEAYRDKDGYGIVLPSSYAGKKHGFVQSSINACCLGLRKTHRGFKWNKLRGHAYV